MFKKIISVLAMMLCVLCIESNSMPVYADNADLKIAPEPIAESEKTEKTEYSSWKEYINKHFDYSIESLKRLPLLCPSYITADELERALKKELAGCGEYFIMCEEEYGLNCVFWASVAAVESGWGEKLNSSNNFFGWNTDTYFTDPRNSILEIGSRFVNSYLKEDGRNFNGYTVKDVCVAYNGREEWTERILNMMNQMYEDILVDK